MVAVSLCAVNGKSGIGNLGSNWRDVMATKVDSVLKQVADREIQFVQLWFTDLLGSLKSIEIPSSELQHALE